MSRRKQNFVNNSEGNIWYVWGILFLGCLLGLYGIVYAVDHVLPTPLKIEDEVNHPDSFIAERAKNYLKPLTDLGPKVAGSKANEVYAVDYLVSTLNEIIEEANPIQEIELSLQSVSGSFYLDYKPYGSINAYASIQNIAVIVRSANKTSKSILLNTHFDSVPTSPGGTDDGMNVAVALEVFRKISQSVTPPRNNIIFLFNGAEESGLLASHGFITQHEWSQDVKVLINLEATGAYGKEMLFQSGPDEPWLLKYYDVPHPHCNAGAEEVFQSNIIPSDTDFRIFRDFGGIIGYDMAFTRDGYRYHTKYDGFDNIEYGSFQHTGDNVLHLVKNLAEAPEVSNPITKDGKVVFFDFLGLFYIHYTADSVAVIINVLTIIVSFGVMIWTCISYKVGAFSSLIYLPVTMFVQLLGIIIACALVLLIGVILDAANNTMSWYAFPTFMFGLYIAPTVFCQLLTTMLIHRFIRHKKISLTKKVIMQIHASRLLWTLVLLVGTAIKVRIVYVIMIPVMFNTVAMCIIQCFNLHNHGPIWFLIYIVSTVLPTMKVMYMAHEALALFIPIMGRFGPSTNPEFLVGLILVLITSKIISYYAPLVLFIRRQWYILLVLLAIFLAAFILVFTPIGFPYQANENHPRPQRYSIYHTQRTFRDDSDNIIKEDAGFYFYKNDRNAPNAIANDVTSLEKAVSLADDCEIAVACGLPVTNSRSLQSLKNSIWIPADLPIFPTNVNCSCSKETPQLTQIKYQCSITGSDRIDVYLSIKKGLKLISISLVDELPIDALTWNDQPTYYISFVYGKEATALDFNFVLEIEETFTGPTVDLAISAKYINDELIEKTDEYKAFLAEFPDWTAITFRGFSTLSIYSIKLSLKKLYHICKKK